MDKTQTMLLNIDLQLKTGNNTTDEQKVELKLEDDDNGTQLRTKMMTGSLKSTPVRMHKSCKDQMMTKWKMLSNDQILDQGRFTYYPRMRQSERHSAVKPPSLLGYEKAILSAVPPTAQESDLPTSYSTFIKNVYAAACMKAMNF